MANVKDIGDVCAASAADAPAARLRRALSDQYLAPLVAFFRRRTGDPSEAEDLAHDVIVRVLQGKEIADVDRAGAFVFTTARNLLRDRARRREVRDRNRVDLETLGRSAEVITPERVIQDRQDLQRVVAALGDLDEKTRDMFVLFRLDGMKHRDIAELYGVSVSAVEKRLMKAFARLMKSTEI